MLRLDLNSKWVRRHHQGGTLLEVLVGLVILALILTSVVDAMGQNRRAQSETQWHNAACHLAMQWRQARLTQQSWSQGDQGTFETLDNQSHHQWRLENIVVPEASVQPDIPWRKLVIQDSTSPLASEFLVRIEDLQPPAKEVQP